MFCTVSIYRASHCPAPSHTSSHTLTRPLSHPLPCVHSHSQGVMSEVPASRGYSGGFSASLMAKDLRIAMHQATPLADHSVFTFVRYIQAISTFRTVYQTSTLAREHFLSTQPLLSSHSHSQSKGVMPRSAGQKGPPPMATLV